jgi:release factor glutamine methyltransferase
MTVHTALLQGAELLDAESILAPRLTAEVLLAHALGKERVYLYAHPEQELSELAWIHYGRYLHQRLKGMPTQYITRHQEFYGRDFRLTSDVLIPRPETEHLVEAALARWTPGMTVVDVGTGSGAIAVTLALEKDSNVIASDLSPAAVAVARSNAERLNARVQFFVGDLVSAFGNSCVDLLVSNPPYVPLTDQPVLQREVRDYEPQLALFGGPTGLELYQRLISDARRVLRPDGWLLVELGYNSVGPVSEMLQDGWRDIEVVSDLAGLPRVLAARYTS